MKKSVTKTTKLKQIELEKIQQICSIFPEGSKVTQSFALKFLEEGAHGAEFDVLKVLARAVLHGESLDPAFQAVVNALMAKVVFSEKLPSKAMGRKMGSGRIDSWEVANDFYDMRDSGISYDQTVQALAQKHNMEESNVPKLASENKQSVGSTKAERKFNRMIRKAISDLNIDLNFDPPEPPDYPKILSTIIANVLVNRNDPFDLLKDSQRKWVESLASTRNK